MKSRQFSDRLARHAQTAAVLALVGTLCVQELARGQTTPESKAPVVSCIQRFLRYYAANDAAASAKLWIHSAPRKEEFQRGLEVLRLRNTRLTIRDSKINIPWQSSVRAKVIMQAVIEREEANGRHVGPLHTVWILDLKREGARWQIQNFETGEDQIAALALKGEQNYESTPLLIEALIRLSNDLETKGDRATAIRAAELARSGAVEIDLPLGIADSLLAAANAHMAISENQSASRELNEAEEIYTRLGDKLGRSRVVHTRARMSADRGELDSALDLFHRAMELADSIGDNTLVARILVSAAGPEMDKGRFRVALSHLTKALEFATATGSETTRAKAFHNLGDFYIEQRDFESAMAWLRQALALKTRLGDQSGIANTLNSMAVVRIYQKRCPEARVFLNRGLEKAKGSGDEVEISYILNQIGSCYTSNGDPARGLAYHRDALQASEKVANSSTNITSLLNIAEDLRLLKRFSEALDNSHTAVEVADRTGDLLQFWQARTIEGHILLDQNLREEGRTALKDAIQVVERLRGEIAGGEESEAAFFSDKVVAYQLMMRSFLDEGRDAEALAYSEQEKGRLLIDILRSGRVNVSAVLSSEERTRERQLRGRLAAANRDLLAAKQSEAPTTPIPDLSRQVNNARTAFETFKSQIFAQHPDLKLKRAEVEWNALPPTEELLPSADTAILEYAVTDDCTYLFVLTRSNSPGAPLNLISHRIPVGSEQIKKLVTAFRTKIFNADYSFVPAAQELYRLLVGPARVQLKGKDTLVIVPDGVLWELPFQVLRRQTRFLLEDFAFVYAPSLAVLHQNRVIQPERQSESKLLAFGNPRISNSSREDLHYSLRGRSLNDLPEAEREVNEAAKNYGNGRSKVYVGADALESRFKAEAAGYSVLHFATHAIRDNLHPLHSFLLFAGDSKNMEEDGILEAWEVMECKLTAELAVLSACETAGSVGNGEGLMGISWAFLVAGTPVTVASQWSVPSPNTSNLMIGFHRELASRPGNYGSSLPKAKALQKAALPMIAKKLHPFYWGSFVVIGTRL